MAIFAQNMNGIPVYPSPKNGERPYPEGRKMVFSTPLFGRYPRLGGGVFRSRVSGWSSKLILLT